jgi:hypothetical protein
VDGDLRVSEPPGSGESFRKQMLARIPGWYSPWGHLAGTLGVGVVTLSVALGRLAGPSLAELATVPCAFVFANLVEWCAHRYLMHERRFPLTVLYDRHTPEHHRVFRYENMAITVPRELKLVLIPAMGVLGMVLLAAPVALALGHLSSWNVGWLFLATAGVYVVGYELSHLAYHLPDRSFVYRVPFLRALREHHARHHVPRLMQRYNFNVTIPLGDLLFGTLASRGVVERAVGPRKD